MSRIRKKVARTFTMPIVMDPDKELVYAKASNALDVKSKELLETAPARIKLARAQGHEHPDRHVYDADEAVLEPLREARDVAKKNLDAVTQKFKFRALGRKHWRALISEHPPAEDASEEEQTYDRETLAPALIEEASDEPKLLRTDVDEIFNGDQWNETEVDLLFQGALAAQVDAGQFTNMSA